MKFSFTAKLIYVLGFIAFLIVGPLVMWWIATTWPMTFLAEQESTPYLGGFVSAVGLLFAVWSNYELVSKGKGGAGNLGRIKTMPETQHLVTTGPYSICRNPMHLGVFLFYMGLSCSLNSLSSLIIPLLAIGFGYFSAVFLDEPRLMKAFPEEFAAYKQQVPRFMPRILARKKY